MHITNPIMKGRLAGWERLKDPDNKRPNKSNDKKIARIKLQAQRLSPIFNIKFKSRLYDISIYDVDVMHIKIAMQTSKRWQCLIYKK